jgi:hypothetical protein
MPAELLEVEINGPLNESYFFPPLRRKVRGCFDPARCVESGAHTLLRTWPQVPIPGERIGVDLESGEGFILEPLHDPKYTPTREHIEKKGRRLAEAKQTYEGIHVATWLHWLKSAVNGGLARVVRGKLPDKLPGKPDLTIITRAPQNEVIERLVEASDRQAAAFDRLASALERVLAKK